MCAGADPLATVVSDLDCCAYSTDTAVFAGDFFYLPTRRGLSFPEEKKQWPFHKRCSQGGGANISYRDSGFGFYDWPSCDFTDNIDCSVTPSTPRYMIPEVSIQVVREDADLTTSCSSCNCPIPIRSGTDDLRDKLAIAIQNIVSILVAYESTLTLKQKTKLPPLRLGMVRGEMDLIGHPFSQSSGQLARQSLEVSFYCRRRDVLIQTAGALLGYDHSI